jgi:Tol biopolymer transport system component/DNA-binding winged helix-turn-helix (wHTH) protein
MSGDFRVGEWEVQPSVNRLRNGDREVRLEPKVMQVLVCLADAGGEVVSREELIARVWPGIFVTDDVLHRAVGELRKVFHDSHQQPRYIETIRKRGYRLLAHSRAGLDTPATGGAPNEAEPTRLFPFAAIAAALVAACVIVIVALPLRSSFSTEAHGRFVPVVSGPHNESDPAIAPDGERIAYAVRAGGELGPADLYLQPRAGATAERLTATAADERKPVWSPDGRSLAFVRTEGHECRLVVLDIASRRESTVSPCPNPDEPRLAWSPRGDALLTSEGGGARHGWRLVRVAVAGGDRAALTTPPAGTIGDHSPAASPDGRHVAFIRHASGGAADVYVMPIDGGSPRRLTFDESDLTGVDWAAGGRALIYSSDRAGGYSLWRVPLAGGVPELVAGGAARLKHPAASRRGDRIAYESWHYEINIWQASLVEKNDPVAPVIRTSDLWNLYPQISPDGTRLAYVSTQSGAHELWLADRDGANARQLTTFGRDAAATARGATVRAARWSPDGRHVVFSGFRDGASDVFVADVATAAVTQVTADPTLEVAPAWSPDGRRILYGARGVDGWHVWGRAADGSGTAAIVIRDGYAVQPGPEGALYFSRADRPGLWKVTPAGAESQQVVDAPSAGVWASWSVARTGIYIIQSRGRDIQLTRVPLAGGTREIVASLPNYSWPGISISPDGSSALYARWDRRESNIMALETR